MIIKFDSKIICFYSLQSRGLKTKDNLFIMTVSCFYHDSITGNSMVNQD